jgi:hypothetical protein
MRSWRQKCCSCCRSCARKRATSVVRGRRLLHLRCCGAIAVDVVPAVHADLWLGVFVCLCVFPCRRCHTGMFQRVMQQLYSNEWLSEEAIFAWNEDTSDEVRRCETICCILPFCARARASSCSLYWHRRLTVGMFVCSVYVPLQHEAGKMKCLVNATKFLQWLRENQEEEEGEEEEEEAEAEDSD